MGLVGLEVHRAARILALSPTGVRFCSRQQRPASSATRYRQVPLGEPRIHRLKTLAVPSKSSSFKAKASSSSSPRSAGSTTPGLSEQSACTICGFCGAFLELAEVQGLVESARLVTRTGAGGLGKTRLCLQVAADLLDGSGDRVWLVGLAPA